MGPRLLNTLICFVLIFTLAAPTALAGPPALVVGSEDFCTLELHSDLQLKEAIRHDIETYTEDTPLQNSSLYRITKWELYRKARAICKARDVCTREEVTQVVQEAIDSITMRAQKERVMALQAGTFSAMVGLMTLAFFFKTEVVTKGHATLQAVVSDFSSAVITASMLTLMQPYTSRFVTFLNSMGYKAKKKVTATAGDPLPTSFAAIGEKTYAKFDSFSMSGLSGVIGARDKAQAALKDAATLLINRDANPTNYRRGINMIAELAYTVRSLYPQVPYNHQNIRAAFQMLLLDFIDKPEDLERIREDVYSAIERIDPHFGERDEAEVYRKALNSWFTPLTLD